MTMTAQLFRSFRSRARVELPYLLLGFFAAASLGGNCAKTRGTKCEVDATDCQGATYCDVDAEACLCKGIGIDGATCSRDSDCPGGETCVLPACQCSGNSGSTGTTDLTTDPTGSTGATDTSGPTGSSTTSGTSTTTGTSPTVGTGGAATTGASTGGSPIEGEPDDVDDCDNDAGPTACVPSMDIVTVGLDCAGGDATVRVEVASGQVNTSPESYDTIEIFLEPPAGGETHWVRAFGENGAYSCDYRIGITYTPLGAEDVCEVNAVEGTFDFKLTAATSGETFEEVTVQSHLSSPYLIDVAGPFPLTCG